MKSGLIVREADPLNLETPLGQADSFLTPNDQFYVRNHFGVPGLDPTSWRLVVTGSVERPFTIGLNELKALPAEVRTVTLECAGNGRVFLVPKVKGLLWGDGAVGTAEWLGVSLRTLLDRSGIKPAAVEVTLEGADSGQVNEEPRTPGLISYTRSVPLAKVNDVLLAYAMNGADLEPNHGRPVRAIVGGWYAMASVKWLSRIIVTDQPFQGYFQTLEYSTFERWDDIPSLVGLTGNAVKAQIIHPIRGETLASGSDFMVEGKAWAGEAAISRVEFSGDGGQTWTDARLIGDPVRHAWREWLVIWKTPDRPGHYALMARATDDQGRIQPTGRDPDLRTYMIHHVIPVEVRVV